MKYSVKKLKEIKKMIPETAIIYFWGHTPNTKKITASCLSQWYDCNFVIDGVEYHTAEQYMMASKAKLFKDEEVYNEIMPIIPATTRSLGGRFVALRAKYGMLTNTTLLSKATRPSSVRTPSLASFCFPPEAQFS